MLLIDDNQPEIFQGREDGAAGANHNAGATGMHFMPFIVALSFG